MRTWPALEVGPLRQTDRMQALLVDYGVAAIDETTRPGAWLVFFATDADRRAAAHALAREFSDLPVTSIDVPDEDWVAKSQADLRAVQVGAIVVAPPWDLPAADAVASGQGTATAAPVVVVIRPSMGFGTGHHATTRLCLAAIQRAAPRGRSVLDVGTGSGVLALAASRLGAARVLAIDDDADAIQAARENLTLNPGTGVILRQIDVRDFPPEPFDLVTANLTGALLRAAAGRLRALCASGGRVILGGFLGDDEAGVVQDYEGLTLADRTEEDGWSCVVLQRP